MIIGKPVFYHTKYDTIDKCTPDQLERAAKAHAYIIEKIQELPAADIISADAQEINMQNYISKKEASSKYDPNFLTAEDSEFIPYTMDFTIENRDNPKGIGRGVFDNLVRNLIRV